MVLRSSAIPATVTAGDGEAPKGPREAANGKKVKWLFARADGAR